MAGTNTPGNKTLYFFFTITFFLPKDSVSTARVSQLFPDFAAWIFIFAACKWVKCVAQKGKMQAAKQILQHAFFQMRR